MSKKFNVYYCPSMQKANNSFSPSASKPTLVIEDWKKHFGDSLNINDVIPFSKEDLSLAHDPKYVTGIFNGTIQNGFGLKDSDFSSTFLYGNASLYQAALDALHNQVAISPTSGFHHAGYNKAEGFCTFNGLIISAIKLHREGKAKKIGILDCDMHYGNGTEELIKFHKLNYIHHYTAGKFYDLHYPALDFLKPTIKKFYNKLFTQSSVVTPQPKLRQKLLKGKGEKFINELPSLLQGFKNCDLIIYQAGADQHINDPYGGLLTYQQMSQRDDIVFNFSKVYGIPLVWNLAGGYQRDREGNIEPVLQCHRITMQSCINNYYN